MITKESLIKDGEQSNTAFLKIKQAYKASDDKVYLIVEGKDDKAYYHCIGVRYFKCNGFEVIIAGNRKNVTKTFAAIDWATYSENRILFFIDRDLSDITKEYTPDAKNVYVTDDYSIENSLFNEELLFIALESFLGIQDLEEAERQIISKLYNASRTKHEKVLKTVMAWVLYWKENEYKPNLNNLKSGDFYIVREGIFSLKPEFSDEQSIVTRIHTSCGIQFEEVDVSEQAEKICVFGGVSKFLRGKYLRAFFVKFANSISSSVQEILPPRKKAKSNITLGDANALLVLCGYMRTPESLETFLRKFCV